ncbi:protein of unknown function [Streptomyces murinus]
MPRLRYAIPVKISDVLGGAERGVERVIREDATPTAVSWAG